MATHDHSDDPQSDSDTSSASSPFTITEVGPPGALQAVADFTCPRCSEFTRFFVRHENEDGGFTCPKCELDVVIRGSRLSDYQQQLDAINDSLGDFSHRIERKMRRAAEDIAADPDGEDEVPN